MLFVYSLLNGTFNSPDCIVWLVQISVSQSNSCLLFKELCCVFIIRSLVCINTVFTVTENILFYRTFLCCRVIRKEKTGAE